MRVFRYLARAVIPAALAVAFAAISAASVAQAGLANATFGYVPLGNTTFSGATLGSATDITIPAAEVVNTVPPLYQGLPNDFVGLVNLGDTVTVNPLTLSTTSGAVSLNNYLQFTTADGNRFSFSMTGINWSSTGSGNLSFQATGTFHDSAGVFGDNAAQLSGAFTQSAPGAAVNASFTFSTPPATSVPEPGSMVVMLGLVGIGSGMGIVRRRRRTT